MPRRSRSSVGPLPLDIQVAVEELGIKIDHVRKDEIWAKCPAHKARMGQVDRHASWSVNMKTGGHKCFSCGWKGPFITLVKWMQSTDDEKAREWIRQMGGFKHLRARMKGETGYEEPVPDRVTEADMALFVPPPAWALEEKDVSADACKQYGVKWDPKNNRWVFPIRDPYTQELRGWQEKNSKVFINYPEHMSKADCLFGTEIFFGPRMIIVESPIDAVHIWTYLNDSYGFPLASLGVNLSQEQVSYVIEHSAQVIWAFDNDKAGFQEAERLRREHLGHLPMLFYNYGGAEDKDPGTQTGEEIKWGIENATSSIITRF